MVERQILFSGPMVRAILAGQKTQTRRVARLTDAGHVKEPRGNRRWHTEDPDAAMACPYGQPGDRLWVREAWQSHVGPYGESIVYAHKATDDDCLGPWRPSIFMPRAFSRMTLEIVSVRFEQLLEITEEDAKSEGVTPSDAALKVAHRPYTESFIELWDSINAKRGIGWDSNPWVWVIEFRRVQP